MVSSLQQAKLIFLCAMVTSLPAVASQAANPPGVTESSIRIGSCSALSGPASFLGIQTQVGALAYFHVVNSQGGVNGRTIDAMVLVEGLRVAGRDLTREKFISAIESLHECDMGLGRDFVLHYSPKDQGFRFGLHNRHSKGPAYRPG